MTDCGDLLLKLDRVRTLLDARWLALAWRNDDGSWNRHLRGRQESLPQTKRRFFDRLEQFIFEVNADENSTPWREFLASWRAGSGYFATFKVSQAAYAYYVVLDSDPDETKEWVDLTLRAIADAAADYKRAHRGITRQQAVLESAASLLSASSEDDVIPRGLGLAMRLVEAQGAAFYQHDRSADQFTTAFVRADGVLHDSLRANPCGKNDVCTEALRTGKVQRYSAADNPVPDEDAVQHAIAVPMLAHEGLQGILYLAGTLDSDFDDLDVNTLTLFARQLAGVLENLRLLRKLRIANQELSQTQAQLVESARLSTLAEMAGGLAHDFNNILGALLGRIQLLQTRITDPQALTGLTKMERLIGEGESTVKRLQEAARVRKHDPTEAQTIDELTREVFGAAEFTLNSQAQIEDKQISWKTDFHPAAGVLDIDDRLRGSLRRFLKELSEQAPAGSTVTVGTGCDEFSNYIRFTLVLPLSNAQITWRWSALEESVGLKRAVADLGGHVDFTAASDTEPCLTLRFAPTQPTSTEEEPLDADSFRVLVVDDDSEVRDVLEELLRLDGHQVTSVGDGSQALELFTPDKYDFVFTDLGMPGISGWQVAETIKRNAPHMPVVMVTGWGAQLDPEKVKSSGVDKVLTKPFQWLAVREALSELSTQKR